jgi:hypothetical protein
MIGVQKPIKKTALFQNAKEKTNFIIKKLWN